MFSVLVYFALFGSMCSQPIIDQPSKQEAGHKKYISPLLSERVDMGGATLPSVETALRTFARNAKVRVHVQFFDRESPDPEPQPIKLTPRASTIGQMLANLKAVVPGLTWTADDDCIIVTILRPGNADPLTFPVTEEAERDFTATQLVGWLNRQNPDFPICFMYEYNSFDIKQSCQLHILPGQTRREVLNAFASQMQLQWEIGNAPNPLGSFITFGQKIVQKTSK